MDVIVSIYELSSIETLRNPYAIVELWSYTKHSKTSFVSVTWAQTNSWVLRILELLYIEYQVNFTISVNFIIVVSCDFKVNLCNVIYVYKNSYNLHEGVCWNCFIT